MEKILVTGATGYIGAHTCVELMRAGYDVVGLDNLVNSKRSVIPRIETAAGAAGGSIIFHEADVRDQDALRQIFRADKPVGVIHFAGLKAVGESVAEPCLYYENNVGGTCSLTRVMQEHGVHRLVFSSSATVYGQPEQVPVDENAPMRPSNPYGHSKSMAEQVIRDAACAHPEMSAMLLRYFNPTGAHPSGLLGEDPRGIPNNLMPFIAQVAVGRRAALDIFGNDYPTADGTCIRDYVHVVDLAQAHVAAINASRWQKGCHAINLGTGQGASVLEVVEAFRRASATPIPVRMTRRRPGDIASTVADVRRAKAVLGWSARYTLNEMCRDVWRWQSTNPLGYE